MGVCCTEEKGLTCEERVEDTALPEGMVTQDNHAVCVVKPADRESLRPAIKQQLLGEDKLGDIIVARQSIPRCSSYYGVAVAPPPPATPRCTTFAEAPPTDPSEMTTRLPSLPEDELHCAPEPCKWDPVFLSLMLLHLDKAEDLAYSAAFSSFAADDPDSVPLDSRELREFLLAHSVLTTEELDQALMEAASDDGSLELAGFLDLIRGNAMFKASAESWFRHALLLGAGPSGEDLTQESCLAGLRLFVADEAQRLPQSALDEQQLERICTSAMDRDLEEIPFEEWHSYCRKVARTITLARYSSESAGF